MSDQRWFRSLYATLDKDQAEAVMRGYVTHAQIRVWLAIFDHVNRSTGEAWPSKRRLAELTNLGRTAVTESIQALVDLGWVVAEPRIRAGDGGQTSNLYRLAITPDPPAAQADPPGRLGGRPPGRPPGRHEPITSKNQEPKNPPPTPSTEEQHERRGQAAEGWGFVLSSEDLWECLSGDARARAPEGTREHLAAVLSVLDRPDRRLRSSRASLVVGAWRRIEAAGCRFGGVEDHEALVVSGAKGVPDAEALAELHERHERLTRNRQLRADRERREAEEARLRAEVPRDPEVIAALGSLAGIRSVKRSQAP